MQLPTITLDVISFGIPQLKDARLAFWNEKKKGLTTKVERQADRSW